MIFWFTGQPGHGKSNQALKMAFDFKAKGREVYVCNVRKFDYAKAGMHELTSEQFRDWMNVVPDGAVVFVDEAYEHDMLPKRAPGAKVPEHVQQLAKHRHRGLDFIFVCQSPDKQVDSFVHDLIERQIHVRRRFGTPYLHLREFDRFERNPEKAQPLTIRRTTFWKPAFDVYESTVADTSERRIPWYFFALPVGLIALAGLAYYMNYRLTHGKFGAEHEPLPVAAKPADLHDRTEPLGDGREVQKPATQAQYIQQFTPRVPGQPWSAPVYDHLKVSSEAPRVFCMTKGTGDDATCSCYTEQATRYRLDAERCNLIVSNGQYEPLRDELNSRLTDGRNQQMQALDSIDRRRNGDLASSMEGEPAGGTVISAPAGVGNGRTEASSLSPIGGI